MNESTNEHNYIYKSHLNLVTDTKVMQTHQILKARNMKHNTHEKVFSLFGSN